MNIWFRFANPSFEELFCENTDKPEMECHGCCKISKINQAPVEKTDFSVPSYLPNHKLSSYLVNTFLPLLIKPVIKTAINNQEYLFFYSFTGTGKCFHPPEIC